MNNFNLKCEELKQSIVDIINESKLPVSSVYYIMEIIRLDIERQYYAILNEESIESSKPQEDSITIEAPQEDNKED